MAIERVLKKLPKMEAPKDARCYICLEGGDDLKRGCGCRGDSAGFVHVECLTKFAVSKEATGDADLVQSGWMRCVNCLQPFAGALDVEMTRELWRRHRNNFSESSKVLGDLLGVNGEPEAANLLYGETSADLELSRSTILIESGKLLEALDLLTRIGPEAKTYYHAKVNIAHVFLRLHRYQDAVSLLKDLLPALNVDYGLDAPPTFAALNLYAVACAKVGNFLESKKIFYDILHRQSRIFGPHHPMTSHTRNSMASFGWFY